MNLILIYEFESLAHAEALQFGRLRVNKIQNDKIRVWTLYSQDSQQDQQTKKTCVCIYIYKIIFIKIFFLEKYSIYLHKYICTKDFLSAHMTVWQASDFHAC